VHPLLPTFYSYAIGRQLAFVRLGARISVSTLAAQLNVTAGELLAWELGAAVSAAVLQGWCGLLGVTATSVLEWAENAVPPGVRGLVVDLTAVSRWRRNLGQHPHKHLIGWARQLSDELGTAVVAVPECEIQRMAARWSTPLGRLVDVLSDLTPVALLPWEPSSWGPDRRAVTG
jgi:transcriptional regulator with XRE-family HTH domain